MLGTLLASAIDDRANDERRGRTEDFEGAFRIAERAGLMLVPHGGELRGPDHVRTCLGRVGAQRLGRGGVSCDRT